MSATGEDHGQQIQLRLILEVAELFLARLAAVGLLVDFAVEPLAGSTLVSVMKRMAHCSASGAFVGRVALLEHCLCRASSSTCRLFCQLLAMR